MKKITESSKGNGKIIIRIFRDRIEKQEGTKGTLAKKALSLEILKITEIPEDGIEIEADSVRLIKPAPLQTKKSKPKKTSEKPLTVDKAVLLGTAQYPGSPKIHKIYMDKTKKSFYLQIGSRKKLILIAKKKQYGKILDSLQKLPLFPADYESAKEELIKVNNLTEQGFNRWILAAVANQDITLEKEGKIVSIKLKEKEKTE